MNGKYSIKDIAQHLNISTTTVSYIINGKAARYRISKQLEKKVLDYVEEIQFIPSQVAQSLRTGKTNLIGLIVDDISNDFYAEIARYIEEKTFPLGYRLLYCSSENDLTKFKELIKLFRERQVDAYIITPVAGSEELIQSLIATNEKLVLFDRYFKSIESDYVIVDNADSMCNATKYLIKKGYHNIGFISFASTQTVMEDRKAGYIKAVKNSRKKAIVKELDFNIHSEVYVNHIIKFLKENKSIDALFFSSSVLAIAGLEALKKLGKKIPDDIAVVSYDDHILFRMYTPSISVVSQPIEQLAQNLISMLTGNDDAIKKVVLPTVFIPRASI